MGKNTITLLVILSMMAALVPAFAGCNVMTVTGSGNLLTWEWDYRDFNRVEVSHAFEVEITRNDTYQVSITFDDSLLEYLDIEQRGNTLRIELKEAYIYHNVTHRAVITMPELRSLNLSGASTGRLSGFSSEEKLSSEISGASSLDMSDIQTGDADFNVSGASKLSGSISVADADLNISGASTVEIVGSAEDMSAEASGASKANLSDFTVTNAQVEFSGDSSGTVNASGRLDIELSGASSLDYYGDAKLGDVNISGGSRLNKK